jgi:hypothetical protein
VIFATLSLRFTSSLPHSINKTLSPYGLAIGVEALCFTGRGYGMQREMKELAGIINGLVQVLEVYSDRIERLEEKLDGYEPNMKRLEQIIYGYYMEDFAHTTSEN